MSLSTFTDNEIQFIAEDELIFIIPSFGMPVLKCIDGDYGPFRAGLPVEVPLWLAIQLKKFKKCQIKCPSWMDVEFLTEHLAREQRRGEFQSLPFHYIEISNLILQHASLDIPDTASIRRLLQDIEDVRMGKSREILQDLSKNNIQDNDVVIDLNGIGAMELNTIRAFCIESLNTFRILQPEDSEQLADMSQSSSVLSPSMSDSKSSLPSQIKLRRYHE